MATYKRATTVDQQYDQQTVQPLDAARGGTDEQVIMQRVSHVVESTRDLYTSLKEQVVDVLSSDDDEDDDDDGDCDDDG